MSKKVENILFSTSAQKILNFLCSEPEKQFTEKEIVQKTDIKKSSVNLTAHFLLKNKLITGRKIGRTSLYGIDKNNAVIREIKILQNIISLMPIIENLKKHSQKIILFGSTSQGINTPKSDIDLFVQSNNPKEIRKIINDSNLRNKIQLIVKTPEEMLRINKEKPLFFEEIKKGKIICENYE
ncbi:MAG: nucleotidyltransferase domain-containing protein [Candidatus Pacebacteria bacterium]|nr:nucleotidyltransferase domain-containing protein [Candidatus Paceibacterota bacterium]